MKMDAINPIFIVAKKEIMDNIRNKWIILVSVLFALLALLASYGGTISGEGWQDLEFTVAIMMGLVQIFISIIGLMLGYAAIIGEIERGSMEALLSLPTRRREILFGKFLGLGTVLTFTILIGFGIAGIVIGINVPNVDYGQYLIFIGASILIGLVFLNIGIFLSCVFQKRSTTMGGAIFVWFLFALIWQMILGVIFVFTSSLEEIESTLSFPDWYYALQLFNPLQTYSTLVSLNISRTMTTPGDIASFFYPSYYSSELMVLILIAWIIIFFFLAFWRFKQKDI
jgi:Cu-processing system permease protein